VPAAQALRHSDRRRRDIHTLAAMIEKPTNGGVSKEDSRVYDVLEDGLRKAEYAQHGSDAFRNIGDPAPHGAVLPATHRSAKSAIISSSTTWRRKRRREPTEKQGKYLKSLFFKLGGKP
jgi:hypothetical protein